mmetsp:Transcript_12072/g.18062  ORF Transcript_12072/g.18062 Transcript_12072/m.18062 type:complete len:381 (-) Transcript_12072:328-1470(-)
MSTRSRKDIHCEQDSMPRDSRSHRIIFIYYSNHDMLNRVAVRRCHAFPVQCVGPSCGPLSSFRVSGALAVHDGRAPLVVLGPGQPQVVEGAQRAHDGAAQPRRMRPLSGLRALGALPAAAQQLQPLQLSSEALVQAVREGPAAHHQRAGQQAGQLVGVHATQALLHQLRQPCPAVKVRGRCLERCLQQGQQRRRGLQERRGVEEQLRQLEPLRTHIQRGAVRQLVGQQRQVQRHGTLHHATHGLLELPPCLQTLPGLHRLRHGSGDELSLLHPQPAVRQGRLLHPEQRTDLIPQLAALLTHQLVDVRIQHTAAHRRASHSPRIHPSVLHRTHHAARRAQIHHQAAGLAARIARQHRILRQEKCTALELLENYFRSFLPCR